MIQNRTRLKVLDNSGVSVVTCFNYSLGYKNSSACLGNIITVSVYNIRKKRRDLVKLKKGQVVKALILRTKKKVTTISNLYFFENSVILLNKQNKLIGTRIFGCLSKNLRYSKFLRVTFLARGLVI